MLCRLGLIALAAIALSACSNPIGRGNNAESGQSAALVPPISRDAQPVDPFWRNATVYFLLTDRFANGDPRNDSAYGRLKDGDRLRSFEGGDIAGIIQKLEAGYFRDLGVTAIWTTPLIEQVHQPFAEYGRSYAFHGYWPRDWTTIDRAYGTEAEFARMVALAHKQGIRVIVDVIMNHAGPPINDRDPAWPADWVRTQPACDYKTYATTATCLIVPALQDIRTESETPVALPPFLLAKWRDEGRLDTELAELDAFFARTKYPRAPKYYLIKWLTDWVRDYGVDGFRVDTAKHVDPEAWSQLRVEADLSFAEWKAKNPRQVIDQQRFFMFGEVYNFGLAGFDRAVAQTRLYNFGDIKVDFFDYGFNGLINMGFATHAQKSNPELFQLYSDELRGPFKGVTVLNYIASHDDGNPYDRERKTPEADAIKLLLAPGGAQIYFGDESARPLIVPDATGDASLRTPMNWQALDTGEGRALLTHWQKIGQFRRAHPAIGAGLHREISRTPFVFSRSLAGNAEPGRETSGSEASDQVVVALMEDQPAASFPGGGVFAEGSRLRDYYQGDICQVKDTRIVCPAARKIALIAKAG